ncbi:MAG: hypothetical protein AB7H97_05340 [Pseudobdellovibrionaceae bacterium]
MKHILMSVICITLFSHSSYAADAWDCSKITIKKFQFGNDCATKGAQPANDPRNKTITVNKGCSIVVDIAGKEKTLNFFVPVSYRSSIGFSWQCENTKGAFSEELAENCRISLYQGTENKGYGVRCECNKIGCGQLLVGIYGTDLDDIKSKLQTAIKRLNTQCDDLNFGGSSTKGDKTDIYMSSLKCPLVERGPNYNCQKYSSPRNLFYGDQIVAVACVPTGGTAETQQPAKVVQ